MKEDVVAANLANLRQSINELKECIEKQNTMMGLNNQFRCHITQCSTKTVKTQITVKFRTSHAIFILRANSRSWNSFFSILKGLGIDMRFNHAENSDKICGISFCQDEFLRFYKKVRFFGYPYLYRFAILVHCWFLHLLHWELIFVPLCLTHEQIPVLGIAFLVFSKVWV